MDPALDLGERLERLGVDFRIGRRAEGAFVIRQLRCGRIAGEARQGVPAGAVLVVEIDGLRQIVDAGLALVGEVLVLDPEEALRNRRVGERRLESVLAITRDILRAPDLDFALESIAAAKAAGCDAVALVCTEFPLLISPEVSPLPTLDSTDLLARAAVNTAVGDHLPTWRGGSPTD